VRVLGALIRRPFLPRLIKLHGAGQLAFFGTQAADSDEGGHLFQSDRGHHSNLMAAS
jgi:hypothetical protein